MDDELEELAYFRLELLLAHISLIIAINGCDAKRALSTGKMRLSDRTDLARAILVEVRAGQRDSPVYLFGTSKRSRFITLFHAFTKSFMNFSFESLAA